MTRSVGLLALTATAGLLAFQAGRLYETGGERSEDAAPADAESARSPDRPARPAVGAEHPSTPRPVLPVEEDAREDGPTIQELQARLAAAYLVGGAADPIPFPADVHPKHAPEAVQAWADALPERCPAAADAVIEVDCGEYPCIVGVAWEGNAPYTEVVCVDPEMADGMYVTFDGPLGSREVRGRLIPMGPQNWPETEKERLSRRWSLREGPMRDLLFDALDSLEVAH